MVVQHNLRAMNSNRMLGLTASAQSKSTEKLSSGYKINRAADDAAGLSISEKMRKQIRGLSQASLNASDGISAVQTAEGALNEVQDMLQRMNELAVKAANSTNSEDDRNYIQDEINQLIDEIDRVAETTKFNETYLLKGDKNGEKAVSFQYQDANVLTEDLIMVKNGTQSTVTAGAYVDSLDTSATYFTKGTVQKEVGAAVTTLDAFTTASIINTDNYYKTDVNGDFVLVNKGELFSTTTTYYTVSFSQTDGKVSAAEAVTQNHVTTDGYFVGTATLYDSNGTQLLTGAALGTTVTLTDYFTSKGNAKYDISEKITNFNTYSTSATSQFTDKDGNEIAANGLYQFFDKAGNYKGKGLYINGNAATTNDIAAYISKGAANIGSLELKLHVGADATVNNQISLKIEAMSASSLGIDGVKVDGADDKNALNAIETVKAALQKVSTQRSALGAVQNRLEHTIANLDNVVENTTAAESQIRDTDMASEMVKYSNNNILAQAGQAMLAQANQSNQGVLSILG